MPDPTGKTISASQVPALWDASPYVTKWMLWQHFKTGLVIDQPSDPRKDWGLRMQPLIIEQVAAEKRLQVIPNADNTYKRRGLLGYTADATIICPDRGPGSLEIKCVFDFEAWAKNWHSGKRPPRHNEIQLQTQMYCGDGRSPYEWGLIAVWLAAEIHYFERSPIPKLWVDMLSEAGAFMASIKEGPEPDAFGTAAESPLLYSLYPTVAESVVDLSEDPRADDIISDLTNYKVAKEFVQSNKPLEEKLRIRLIGIARDKQTVILKHGVRYRVRASGKGKTVVPDFPWEL